MWNFRRLFPLIFFRRLFPLFFFRRLFSLIFFRWLFPLIFFSATFFPDFFSANFFPDFFSVTFFPDFFSANFFPIFMRFYPENSAEPQVWCVWWQRCYCKAGLFLQDQREFVKQNGLYAGTGSQSWYVELGLFASTKPERLYVMVEMVVRSWLVVDNAWENWRNLKWPVRWNRITQLICGTRFVCLDKTRVEMWWLRW